MRATKKGYQGSNGFTVFQTGLKTGSKNRKSMIFVITHDRFSKSVLYSLFPTEYQMPNPLSG